ncbi:MAG TPA: hypothetical protein VEI57_14905, partial [Nitrospirota bacterium]|nr:hypothetical protein [Nitrospirota bacterium]
KIADLIPAGTVTAATGTVYPTDYFETWTSELAGVQSATSGTFVYPLNANINVSDAANGNYSYTFTTAFGSKWLGFNNGDYKATNIKRVMVKITGSATINNTINFEDFAGDPGSGATASALPPQREFVTIQACQQCHSEYMDNAAHAANYPDTRACDLCHSPLYQSLPRHTAGFMDSANAMLPVFIHMIHDSRPLGPNGPGVVYPVSYPRNIENCVVCHTNSGLNLGAGDETGNWKNNPNGRACASCHTLNTFTESTATVAGTMTHDLSGTIAYHSAPPAAPKTDAQCTICHAALGTAGDFTDIVTAHSVTLPIFVAPAAGVVTALTTSDSPEYHVVITMSTPSNGSYYVTGETPTVTITLTNNDLASSAVPTVLTSNPGHQVGNYDPNSLAIANLYVYGPRDYPKPSFLPAGKKSIPLLSTYFSASRSSCSTTTATTTNTNINITRTPTGFTYQLQPITAADFPGTYFVRVYVGNTYASTLTANCGSIPDQIVSYGITSFQVDTATKDLGVTGNANGTPACMNCHGNEPMHRDDHAAPFDPDHCNACHYIGEYGNGVLSSSGDPISNRVHAVHSNSKTGDLSIIDWSVAQSLNVEPIGFATATVTYPSNIERCAVCHSSGNTGYKMNLYEIPCYGCHADVPGAPEHMAAMLGSLTTIVSGTTGTTQVPESCVVCHQPGQDVSIADTP